MRPAVAPDGSPIDLRDPHLCITPDGRLMLNSAVAYHGRRDMQSLAWFSQDGTTWSKPVLIAEHQFWLWRPTWHKGVAYGVGRIASQRIPRLYRSHDGRHFEVVVKEGEFFPDGPGGSEATLRFLADDTALCLLRMTKMPGGKTGNAQLGIARPPYTRWEWKDLGAQIGGPNMIPLPDGRFVAAVRLYEGQVRTALGWLDPQAGKLTEFLTLPSGGDTSYAGLVLHDGLLWVSYYSSHEGKTSIYLAKVQIPERGEDRDRDPAELEAGTIEAIRAGSSTVGFWILAEEGGPEVQTFHMREGSFAAIAHALRGAETQWLAFYRDNLVTGDARFTVTKISLGPAELSLTVTNLGRRAERRLDCPVDLLAVEYRP